MDTRIMNTCTLLLVCAALLLGGCSTLNIPAPEGLRQIELSKSPTAPTNLSPVLKVVTDNFYAPDDSKLASLANVPTAMSGKTEQFLAEAGVEIVDRNDAKDLLEEVRLIEIQQGAGRYEGPQVAQYVVLGRIDSVDTASKYSEAYIVKTNDGTKRYPEKCKYSAHVRGRLRIYTVPQLKMDKSIALQGSGSTSEEGTCRKKSTDLASIIRAAGVGAVSRSRTEIQNFFARKAYVIEMREIGGKQYIVKVDVGSQGGLNKGDAVDIYAKVVKKHPLTGETYAEEPKITSGKVTNRIGTNYAWILLDEPAQARRIEIGNFIKEKHTRGILETITGVLQR